MVYMLSQSYMLLLTSYASHICIMAVFRKCSSCLDMVQTVPGSTWQHLDAHARVFCSSPKS